MAQNDLYIGMKVITAETANLRAEPGRHATLLQTLPSGHHATITAGPAVADELTWWQIDGAGWCVERVGDDDVLEVAPATEWEKAVAFVLRQEGGYIDDPSDAGGRTKYGISQRSYPALDIANLTKAEAKEIYWHDYWLAAGCDRLTWPLSFAHFDAAVNCGIGQATHFLERSDYNFERYNELRRSFYRGLNQFGLYGHGWMRRVDELEQAANA
jgi:hypothetical protein